MQDVMDVQEVKMESVKLALVLSLKSQKAIIHLLNYAYVIKVSFSMELMIAKIARLLALLVKVLQIIVCLVLLRICQHFREFVAVMRDMCGVVMILSVWPLILIKTAITINMKWIITALLNVMTATPHVSHVLALLLKIVSCVLKDLKR
mmetsp:Transcript_26629/g.4723  ORF Transcript_26629/g.4723 Transcript_26629/m.4723 type:complete len:149 (+) Transcript_26629:4313-4759(+)